MSFLLFLQESLLLVILYHVILLFDDRWYSSSDYIFLSRYDKSKGEKTLHIESMFFSHKVKIAFFICSEIGEIGEISFLLNIEYLDANAYFKF